MQFPTGFVESEAVTEDVALIECGNSASVHYQSDVGVLQVEFCPTKIRN